MAGLTLFFKTAEEFYTWARQNIPEFISNGGTGAINNDISTARSFSEANLTTAKGKFSIAQGVAQFINNAQVVINTMDVTRASKVFGSTVEYGMKTAARSLDLVYIGFKTLGYSTNDNRLTIFNNQIE